MEWVELIKVNQEDLLVRLKDAYRKSLDNAGRFAGRNFYQVELDREGVISTDIGNGGYSEEVRNGDAIAIYNALIPDDFGIDKSYEYTEEEEKERLEEMCNFFDADVILKERIFKLEDQK